MITFDTAGQTDRGNAFFFVIEDGRGKAADTNSKFFVVLRVSLLTNLIKLGDKGLFIENCIRRFLHEL